MTDMTKTYKVGDIAYCDCSQFGQTRVASGKVVSISATGIIAVQFSDHKISFNANGVQRTSNEWNKTVLIDHERYQRGIEVMQRKRIVNNVIRARQALNALGVNTASKQQLIDAVDLLRARINAL
jgi:hypothetical protein